MQSPTTLQTLRIRAGDYLELNHLGSNGTLLLPYKHVKMLGHGGSATVDEVEDTNTGRLYARKSMGNVHARNMKDVKNRLYNEVQVMQRLASHHHFVKLHATIVMGRDFTLIMEPVAKNGDLARFLEDCQPGTDRLRSRKAALQQSFGCLTAGLAFMHKNTVRHKDIKPQNILVHSTNSFPYFTFLYTDFGLSLDFGSVGHSTTDGLVQVMTRRYCAPEVIDGGPRSTSSDIYSVGCVFLEIAVALDPGFISEEILKGPFHETLDPAHDTESQGLFQMGSIGEAMIRKDPLTRPIALDVVSNIGNCNSAGPKA